MNILLDLIKYCGILSVTKKKGPKYMQDYDIKQFNDDAVKERFQEMIIRLYIIHRLRWSVGDMFNTDKDNDFYIEAQELLGELEINIWEYILIGKKINEG